jgi:DUF4097 and DUF4098 domain-containing protein YvlB
MSIKPWSMILAGACSVFALPALSAAPCAESATRNAQLDAKGATKAVIAAGAGELKVKGEPGRTQLQADGQACASSKPVLEQIRLESRREGDTLFIKTVFPEQSVLANAGVSNAYARLDLTVLLPDTLDVNIQDTSGSFSVQNVRSAVLADSSGDLEVRDIAADLTVTDSSGEINIAGVAGNLSVTDSSGDVDIERVKGAVRIPVDSSGDIQVKDVGSVHILTDSSGDIDIQQIRGDVLIDNDSSGDIEVSDVGGKLVVSNDGSGKIRQQKVAGTVSLPSH